MTSPITQNRKGAAGLTLIELCIVLLLIAITVAIAVPKYGSFIFRGTMRSEARRLSSMVRYLSNEASRTRTTHYLNFDVSKGKYWVSVDTGKGRAVEESTHLTRLREVPDGVRIKDVQVYGRGKKSHGKQRVGFYQKGESDEAIVHFCDQGKKYFYSLHIKPYNGSSAAYDYYFKGYKEKHHSSFR